MVSYNGYSRTRHNQKYRNGPTTRYNTVFLAKTLFCSYKWDRYFINYLEPRWYQINSALADSVIRQDSGNCSRRWPHYSVGNWNRKDSVFQPKFKLEASQNWNTKLVVDQGIRWQHLPHQIPRFNKNVFPFDRGKVRVKFSKTCTYPNSQNSFLNLTKEEPLDILSMTDKTGVVSFRFIFTLRLTLLNFSSANGSFVLGAVDVKTLLKQQKLTFSVDDLQINTAQLSDNFAILSLLVSVDAKQVPQFSKCLKPIEMKFSSELNRFRPF